MSQKVGARGYPLLLTSEFSVVRQGLLRKILQRVHKIVDGKVARVIAAINAVTLFCKPEVVPNASIQKFAAELAGKKTWMVMIPYKNLALSDPYSTAELASMKRLEEPSTAKGDQVRVDHLLCFLFGQFGEALEALVNSAATQARAQLYIDLLNAYHGSQLSCLYILPSYLWY